MELSGVAPEIRRCERRVILLHHNPVKQAHMSCCVDDCTNHQQPINGRGAVTVDHLEPSGVAPEILVCQTSVILLHHGPKNVTPNFGPAHDFRSAVWVIGSYPTQRPMEPRGIAPLIRACKARVILFHQGPMASGLTPPHGTTVGRAWFPTTRNRRKGCYIRVLLTPSPVVSGEQDMNLQLVSPRDVLPPRAFVGSM